jgi:hypothetical protein
MSACLASRIVLLGCLLALTAAAPRAERCTTLQAFALGDGALIMLGHRESGTELPDLRLPGCGSSSPLLDLRWSRDAGGRWSAAGELPRGIEGLVFEHRKRSWTATLPRTGPGRPPAISLGPLGPDSRLARSEAPREPAALSVAVAGLDAWHLALVQQLPESRLLVEELTSHGSAEELERTSRLLVAAGWPAGTRLLGVAGEAGRVAAFARGPQGEVFAVVARGEDWGSVASLPLPRATEAAGLWIEGRPAVVAAGQGELRLWLLEGLAWVDGGSLPVEVQRPWAATTVAGGRAAVVAAWTGLRLEAWSWKSGAWSRERVPEGRESAVVRPARLDSGRAGEASAGPQRAWMWLGLAAALIGAVLTARLVGRR